MPDSATPYDAVLFDFDGVLVDSEPLHFACWRDVAATIGLKIDWDWYATNAIGVSDREMIALVCEANSRPDLVPALWNLFDEKKRLFAERIVADVPMPQEVRGLLQDLNALNALKPKERKLPIAVVSTTFRSEVEPALIAAGVRRFIATLVCGDDVQNLKPHPEPYLTAAHRLNATNPLVVEDSETGAAAGQAAGFQVLRVKSPAQTPALVRAALYL